MTCCWHLMDELLDESEEMVPYKFFYIDTTYTIEYRYYIYNIMFSINENENEDKTITKQKR